MTEKRVKKIDLMTEEELDARHAEKMKKKKDPISFCGRRRMESGRLLCIS